MPAPRGSPELLRTKLVAPPIRPGALPRSSLVARLDAASAPGRTTLVVAGAGWGKSTLVASWLRAVPGPSAWFSVDPTDDDPVRFWAYVLAALDTASPGVAQRAVRLLRAPGTSTVDDVVPALVNELSVLPEPIILVVDDYHLVTSPEVHRGMELLLARLPATLRPVLIGRAEPALSLAALRGRGRLAELGVDDLRLSEAETADLLAAEAPGPEGPVWGPCDAARWHARTEGWVAGLHLAALSRRPRPEHTDPVSTRTLADYLSREVLGHVPGEVRALLRRTALLDRFTPDLCGAVCGHPDAAALLARVESDQLFVVPLDERGEWYRHHHMFAEVLHADLVRSEPELVPELHRRAARWLAAHDQPVAAVSHALAGDDRALAGDLVATHGSRLARNGEVDTVLGWLRALGEPACRSDPRLALVRSVVAADTGQPEEVGRWADLAERALDAAGPAPATLHAVRVGIALRRWAGALFTGDAGAGLRHAQQAADLAGPHRDAFVLLGLGVAQFRAARFAQAWATLSEAEAAAGEGGEQVVALVAAGLRGFDAAVAGLSDEAARHLARAEGACARQGLGEHYNASLLAATRGELALADGRLGEAVVQFDRATELVSRGGLRVELAEMLTCGARAHDRLGHDGTARRHLDQARRVLARCPDPGHLVVDPRTVVLAADRRPPGAPGPVRLSARQAEILPLLADDLTSAEIGDRLALSTRTVEAHLRSLYRKLGVRTRTAATRYAVENGLISSAER